MEVQADDTTIERALERWREDCPQDDLTATSIIIRLHHLALVASIDLQAVLKPYRLGPGEMDVLFCLDNGDPDRPMRAGDLSRGCMVTTGTITGRVDRLEALGLARREAAPVDRRSIMVRLTAEGRALTARLRRVLTDTSKFHAAVCSLPAEDQRELSRLMKRLSRAVDAQAASRQKDSGET